MPALHTYRIRQTMEVEVQATSVANAVTTAINYGQGKTTSSDIGTVSKLPDVVDVKVKMVS